MRLRRSSIVSTDTLVQLSGSKQAIGLDHIALAMDPFRLNGITKNIRVYIALMRIMNKYINPGIVHWLEGKVECSRTILSVLSQNIYQSRFHTMSIRVCLFFLSADHIVEKPPFSISSRRSAQYRSRSSR
jgi:hypothetical protein